MNCGAQVCALARRGGLALKCGVPRIGGSSQPRGASNKKFDTKLTHQHAPTANNAGTHLRACDC